LKIYILSLAQNKYENDVDESGRIHKALVTIILIDLDLFL